MINYSTNIPVLAYYKCNLSLHLFCAALSACDAIEKRQASSSLKHANWMLYGCPLELENSIVIRWRQNKEIAWKRYMYYADGKSTRRIGQVLIVKMDVGSYT